MNASMEEHSSNEDAKVTSSDQITSETEKTQVPFKSDELETPASLASRYRLIQKIGFGSQAHVYEAESLSDGMRVAVKELRIDSIQAWKEYDLFMRETDVLRSLNMKGVAKFYESIEDLNPEAPRAYIVQELIEGKSIAQMLNACIRLNLQRIFQLAIDMIELLKQLHQHDPAIIHRDIKPSNIILKPVAGDQYEPYLIDFGAVANPQVQSGGSTVAGTYGYMPPEQLMGHPTPASDIYALAATLTYLISGKDPAEMQISDFRLIIEPHLESMPAAVTETLHQMLDPNPSKRLVDYDALKRIFNAFLHDDYSNSLLHSDVSDDTMRNVLQLGQAGNIDIWSNLPTATPREIPKLYQNLQMAPLMSERPLVKKLFDKANTTKNFLFPLLFSFAYLLYTSLETINFISIELFSKSFLTESHFVYTYHVGDTIHYESSPSVLIYLIISIAVFYSVIRLLRAKSIDNNKIALIKEEQFNKNRIAKVHTLLQKGKKSIATIIDVEYLLEIDDSNKETYELEGDTVASIYYNDVPNFKLRYSFNPPDDADPNDLVHEVIIHYDPQTRLQKGQPLPILYYVDPKYRAHVMSMPYPYPVGDILKLSEIFCECEHNKIVNRARS